MVAPKIRSAYSPRVRVTLDCPEAGRTKQAMKDECDVNKILARFQRTGVLDFVETRQAQYGDVTGIEFRESMQKVAEATEMFDALPAKVRKHFDHDPAAFLDFVSDPANEEEAIKLGLLEAAKDEPDPAKLPPKPVEPAPEPAEPA